MQNSNTLDIYNFKNHKITHSETIDDNDDLVIFEE